ncbi:MAG: hypothetical protein N3I35_13740 [Clostridia bacterium]|nr:hypothetical protein [Clostridia bacterium]
MKFKSMIILGILSVIVLSGTIIFVKSLTRFEKLDQQNYNFEERAKLAGIDKVEKRS